MKISEKSGNLFVEKRVDTLLYYFASIVQIYLKYSLLFRVDTRNILDHVPCDEIALACKKGRRENIDTSSDARCV